MATQASTVHISPARRGDLTCHYQNEFHPQGTFIALDIRDGEMWAAYNPEIGNAVPVEVWHGLVRRYSLHTQSVIEANRIMKAIRPLAERVIAGSEEHWNGSNHVARLTDDAREADDEIEERISTGRI